MPSLQDLIGFVPLMKAIQTIPSGVPKPLPDAAYKPKEQIVGDKARQFLWRGSRKAAKVQPYGSPPRRVQLLGRNVRDIGLLFTHEEQQFRQELVTQLMLWMDTDGRNIQVQELARQEVLTQTEAFKSRLDTLRTASVHYQVSNGVIYLDADGNMLPTSSGAVTTIDSGIKASHKGQIDPGTGALVDSSWANPATDIPTQIARILQFIEIDGGRPVTTAIYGKNISGYIANNNLAKYWLARNTRMQEAYESSPQWIPDGMFGIPKWIPAIRMWHEADDGTIIKPFPDDQITLCPDFESDAWGVAEGSFPIPTGSAFTPAATIEAALAQLSLQFGMFQWAKIDLTNIPSSTIIHGDTFLPWWNVPDSVALVDVTP